jgi:hypothetical protein
MNLIGGAYCPVYRTVYRNATVYRKHTPVWAIPFMLPALLTDAGCLQGVSKQYTLLRVIAMRRLRSTRWRGAGGGRGASKDYSTIGVKGYIVSRERVDCR